MRFQVFQCTKSPDYFIVTDAEHVADIKASLCPDGGKLKDIGEYAEMGEERVAFDESLAIGSIRNQGYFRFEASSMAAVSPSPEMP